jgi:hypothetical protein
MQGEPLNVENNVKVVKLPLTSSSFPHKFPITTADRGVAFMLPNLVSSDTALWPNAGKQGLLAKAIKQQPQLRELRRLRFRLN